MKICGIKTRETAIAACQAGVDFLGFVFAESSREVTPEEAARIVTALPNDVAIVGVFVNETKEKIETVAERVNLDYVQLHGDESPEFCKFLSLPVIKAFSLREKSDLARLKQFSCDYYLVDSPGIDYRGGSGIPFEWNLLDDLDVTRDKLILAGGLNESNVKKAIKQVQPAVVDVSSGVETNGEKDLEKIANFIRAAKQGMSEGEK